MARVWLAIASLAAILVSALGRPTAEEAAVWNTHALGVVQSGQQAGKVVQWLTGNNSINVYIAAPASNPKPTAAIVVFTDIYGYELNNTRLWADRLAKATGFLVVLPDFFRGDALTDATRSQIGEWRLRHPKERVLKDFEAIVAEVKKAYPSVKKIGQQGFCWGGLYSGLLSGPNPPKVDAAVGFHPSGLTPADIDAVVSPISLQAADPSLDNAVNATFYAFIDKAFAAKRAKGIPAYIVSYKDMPHGFALRGNLSDPAWAKASSKAFDEGAAFLKAHLTPAGAQGLPSLKVNLLKAVAGAVAPKPAPAAAKP